VNEEEEEDINGKTMRSRAQRSSDTMLNFTISMVKMEEMQKLNQEEKKKVRENSRFIELD